MSEQAAASGKGMIELAPQHKAGLQISNPLMLAAGCYGLGSEYRGLADCEPLGAVVVGPLTLHPRRGAAPPRSVPVPGGVLLHTGLENPGLPSALRRYTRIWERSPAPAILHLAGTTPDEVTTACERLAFVEPIVAVELGLRDGAGLEEVSALVAAAHAAARQPLLVRLPLIDAPWLAAAAVQAGADALTIAAPPRGTVLHDKQAISGRLYGPFVFPLALRALQQVAEIVDVPLIGCGGVYTTANAQAFLQSGAVAVQIDAALWQDPLLPARIARALAIQ